MERLFLSLSKDGRGGGDNLSCKTCKAPAKLCFYRLDALPVAQSTVSKH